MSKEDNLAAAREHRVATVRLAQVSPDGSVRIVSENETFEIEVDQDKQDLRVGSRTLMTPEIDQSHAEWMKTFTIQDKLESEQKELSWLMRPVLRRRYCSKHGLNVLELGPAYSTIVAETLKPCLRRYTAVDHSAPFLSKQREFLSLDPELSAKCTQKLSDSYNLPVTPLSQQLVVASCHPPLVSGPSSYVRHAIHQVWQSLAPDGEFVVVPWYFQEWPPHVNEFLFGCFQLTEMVMPTDEFERRLLVLRKRAA